MYEPNAECNEIKQVQEKKERKQKLTLDYTLKKKKKFLPYSFQISDYANPARIVLPGTEPQLA